MTKPAPKDGASQWDVLEEDKGLEGVSPEIAHALLEMNPALRAKGMNTNLVIEQSKKQSPQPAKPTTSAETSASILTAVTKLKQGVATEDKLLGEEITKLQTKRAQIKVQAAEKLIQWLMHFDPELRSPMTQQVLESEKPFLDGIGFSIKRYVEARKKDAR